MTSFRISRRYALAVVLLLLALFLGLFPASDLTPDGYYRTRLGFLTGPDSFGLSWWTVRTVVGQLRYALVSAFGSGATPEQQQAVLQSFFAGAADVNRLETEINNLAVRGVAASDPRLLSLEQQLNDARQKRAQESLVVEQVIAHQVQDVLKQENISVFQMGNVFFPPVFFKLIDLPHVLVISYVDRIQMRDQVAVRRSLTLGETDDLESAVDQALNVRSLVVPIGGYSTYPTMVSSTGPRDWMIGTVSHEWCHVYLTFYPLGMSYGKTGDATAMNETVCSLFGDEVGAAVLEAYYGEARKVLSWQTPPTPTVAVPPGSDAPAGAESTPGASSSDGSASERRPEAAQPFNPDRELRRIYLAAEERLKAGDIAGAEQVMEEGRQNLAAHGVYIRKLNQAFFAFYGSYAEGPGAIRPDTIGDDLRELRRRSPTLRDFMLTVQNMTGYEDLQRALGK